MYAQVIGPSRRVRRRVPPASSFTSFLKNTSAASGTADRPFSWGVGLKNGRLTSIACDIPNYQVTIKSLWPGTSYIRHAIISGRHNLAQNVQGTITLSQGTPPGGTALTASDIATAAPTSTVQLGAHMNVNLSAQLATPEYTWDSGPELVHACYRATGSNGTFCRWWVKLWVDGTMDVMVGIYLGHLDNGAGAVSGDTTQTYTPTVTIGGVTVYSTSVTHFNRTRWFARRVIGTDPLLTPLHDIAELRRQLVPNYVTTLGSPDSATLTALVGSDGVYTPMMQGSPPAHMPGTGFATTIGLLPNEDALYYTSGDPRAFRSIIVNALAINGRHLIMPRRSDGTIPKPSDWGTWTRLGPGGGGSEGSEGVDRGDGITCDLAHQPMQGYSAYLLTGDPWHLETLGYCAASYYLYQSSSKGTGVNRAFRHDQTRATGWGFRTVGHFVAIAPNTGSMNAGFDTIAADYKTWMQNGWTFWEGKVNAPSASDIGFLFSVGFYSDTDPLAVAPWMGNFVAASLAQLADIEPDFSNNSAFEAVLNYCLKLPVGMLGADGTSGYCFNNAANYNITVATFVVSDFTPHYPDEFLQTFAEVQTATHGGTSCSNTLAGTSGSLPANATEGYWGNLLPAIAYAKDRGITGAAAAYARLTGATNWLDIQNTTHLGGFRNTPVWGIWPRT